MSEPQPTQQPGGKQSAREDALAVVRRLREVGHVAYFAGGCVRDQVLGLEPKDYDVATDAPPTRVRELFSNTQAVGAAFGVILVRQRKSQIEVATFRTDGKYVDGRRPETVVFTTAEEDAKRRDFTINGMFFDPVEERVIDYVGGQADLRDKVLRAIGEPDHRFEEDHLRMLRAVRFASRFRLTIEPVTAAAIAAHAQHLKRISPERVAEELRMMLWHGHRIGAVRMLRQFGLDRVVLRFLPDVRQPVGIFEALPDEYYTVAVGLAALVLDAHGGVPMSKPQVKAAVNALRQGLKISNDECAEVEGALSFAHLLGDPWPPRVATMKRFLGFGGPGAAGACELMAAARRCGIMPERIGAVQEQLSEIAKLGLAGIVPLPLVTGDDLTAAGMQPGPVFKRVLDAVYDAQLEARVTTKEEAMRLAMELAK
jgi:poly(A) polymerase